MVPSGTILFIILSRAYRQSASTRCTAVVRSHSVRGWVRRWTAINLPARITSWAPSTHQETALLKRTLNSQSPLVNAHYPWLPILVLPNSISSNKSRISRWNDFVIHSNQYLVDGLWSRSRRAVAREVHLIQTSSNNSIRVQSASIKSLKRILVYWLISMYLM